jgi:hypothetical protein
MKDRPPYGVPVEQSRRSSSTPSCAVTSLPSTTTELGIRVPREYLLTIGVQR